MGEFFTGGKTYGTPVVAVAVAAYTLAKFHGETLTEE